MIVSVKFQITLPDTLAAEMKAEAQRQGVSLAQWIRETARQRLSSRRSADRQLPLTWLEEISVEDDPGVSEKIDAILYGK